MQMFVTKSPAADKPKKLLERVKAAESAIFNRIQAISPTLAAERQAIEDALANLRVIRRENLGLPVKQR